ncbi:MAG: ABC transporter ATP-binding protein, partial [Halobacteriota archaeon]
HILEQVEAICDRVGILNEGRLVALDSIDGLRTGLETDSRLSVAVDRVDEMLLDTVRGVSGVRTVTRDGDTLSVGLTREAKLSTLRTIDDAGYDVVDFSTDESSLEDLFAAFTASDSTLENAESRAVESPPEVDR